MSKFLKIIITTLFVMVVLSVGLNFWYIVKTPKIAYVRSAVVVERFTGMKEAIERYEFKVSSWQKNIDTLNIIYNNSIKYFEENRHRLSKDELIILQDDIKQKEQDLKNYSASVETMASDENEKLTQGALNQINSYVKKYAEEHNIILVIGVTLSGNVLFGADDIDITDEIIEGLNKSYK